MNGSERVRPLMGRIQHEHGELKHLLRDLDDILHQSSSRLADRQQVFCGRLSDLRRYLKAHFAEEEAGGCMEEALSYAPHLATEAAALEREHPVLLHELDMLLTKSGLKPTPDSWKQCEAECAAFVSNVLEHERRENHLLQSGLNAELDLEDH